MGLSAEVGVSMVTEDLALIIGPKTATKKTDTANGKKSPPKRTATKAKATNTPSAKVTPIAKARAQKAATKKAA